MRRSRKKSVRPLVRRPLVSLEYLEGREVPAAAFALSGTNLLSFDTASPTITQTTAITGITGGETLVGIDFRAQNGLLYGLGVDATNDIATLYAISTRTGAATAVGTAGQVTFTTDGTTKVDLPDPATVGYGIDFNPAADRFRVVAGSLNFRVNPNTGGPVDGDNTGLTSGTVTGTNPDGPINAGTTTVDAAGYTNNQPNNGGVTTQYTLDASTDQLFIQAPPNTGTQTLGQTVTLGGSTLDFTAVNGFDIPAGVNAAASNTPVVAGSAFAVLNVGGTTGLYSINLVDATATLVGNVGTGATAVSGLAVQSDLGGLPAIALDATGGNLLRFNTATPGTVTTQALNTAAVVTGETLVGIDFRPQTGQLYALGIDATAETGTLYLVDPQTGVVSVAVAGTASAITFAGVDFPDPATAGYGFDFNPTVDRIRVTTSTGLNFRINPNNGLPASATPDGAITGLPGGSTGVSATAYTNSFGQSLTGGVTTQYTLDAASNSLFIQNPPNNGTQTNQLPITEGGTPLDFTDINGFDIPAGVRVGTSAAPVASGFAYASLVVSGTTSLYRIDLTTGAATNLGAVGAGATPLAGFALADAAAGTVAFAAATATVNENGGTAALTLTRTGGTTGELTVTVNVTGGTAAAGADFTAGPYTATFADGATVATLNVPIADDVIFEGNETIVLTIAAVNNAAVIGTPNVSTLTITENDPQQTFAVTDAQGFALIGGTLSAFSSTNPGASLAPIALTGVTAGETLVAIDYRPQNGLLYGLGVDAANDTATLYLISPRGGVATAIGTAGQVTYTTDGTTKVDLPDPATVDYDIDFNPAVDRVRVVAGGLNFRINPNTGAPVDGGVATGTNPDGAINGGTTTVGGTAYTNSFPNNGGVTTQFTLDASTDKLFVQNPPNNGTQVSGLGITVGGNPLDFTAVKGFDILAGVNAPASNGIPAAGEGLAVLTVGGSDILYRIDLTTGAATVLGPIGASPAGIDSVAFQSDLGLVPTISLVASPSPQLVRANDPAGLFTVSVTGVAAGESLVGIDFRPQTGQLYGLGINATAETGTLYLLDPQTGAATAVGTPGAVAFQDAAGVAVDLPDPATAGYGLDFNPAVDKLRVVTSTGLNFRVNPLTGAAIDGDLGGAAGSVANTNTDGNINGTGVTGVSATAYTNDFGQVATGKTTQYTLDDVTNSLYIQTPPNSGTQTAALPITLGGNPLDFTAVNGFDIGAGVSVAASNAAAVGVGLANLTVGGSAGLYRIDLATGEAALVGTLGSGATSFAGLATADTPAGTIAFTAAAFNKLEAGGTLDLTLTRTGGTGGAVTVTVTLTDGTATGGTDFTADPITVTFADGATTATASVPLTDDALDELDETFTATITAPTNGAVLGAQTTATATIVDDDGQPTVSVADAKVVEGNAGTTQLVFTLTLSNATSQTVTVTADTSDVTAIAGKDYTAVAGKLVTFAPGETTQTVSIDVTGETIFEADETFKLALSAPTNATLGIQPTAVGTITNDDTAPTVTINSVSVAEGDDGTTAATFTVTLSAASEVPVTVTVDTKDGTAKAGSDYTAVAGKVVTIAAGATTATFAVTISGDTVNEADETFTAVLSNPTGATIATGGGTGTGTITNDDAAPTLTINDMATFEGNAGTTTLTFTVTLTGATDQTVTVSVATADNSALAGSDYVALAATTLTFAPGETTKTVTVTVTGDTVVENDETFLVQLSNPTVGTIADGTGFATIVNDDNPVVPPVNKTLLVGVPNTAIGAGSGTPTVRVIDAAGKQLSSGPGLPATFTGGVRTAVADVNGDGTPDIIVGSGPGSITLVRVLDGVTNKEIFTVQPFEGTFTGGVYVAAGDVNGDGFADIAISPDRGGGPRVDIYSGKVGFAKIDSFFGIDDPNFRGGARVAIGDINGDGVGDLVVAAGFQGGPRVAAFNGKSLGTATRVKLFNDFFAFEPTLRNGAFVTVGDVNGDGFADIIAGGGPNGGPRVTAFNAKTLISSGGGQLEFLANFFAGDPNTRTGVQLAVKDIDGDNKADLRTVVGGQDQVLTFLGKDLTPTGTPPSTTLDGLPDFNGGVFVG
jgi:hypothetical protein